MEFVPILVLGATIKKIVDFAQFARRRDFESILIQVMAWAGGIGLVMLTAHTAWAATVNIGDFTLARINLASQILAGIALGSAASLAHDAVPHPEPRDDEARPAVGAHRK